jgi:hypothetical protein
MVGRRIASALLVGLAGTGPLHAGEAQDRLFTAGVLEPVATGQRLVFGHDRGGAFDSARLPVVVHGEMSVTLAETDTKAGWREAVVTAREAEVERTLVALPESSGHPILLIFLESTVRDVAALTGGNPYYIRNRIREALAAQDVVEPAEIVLEGTSVPGERLVFRPFTEDPNRDRLGALADLEISVTLSAGVPGEIARLEAVAPMEDGGEPAFSETIVFERAEGG